MRVGADFNKDIEAIAINSLNRLRKISAVAVHGRNKLAAIRAFGACFVIGGCSKSGVNYQFSATQKKMNAAKKINPAMALWTCSSTRRPAQYLGAKRARE